MALKAVIAGGSGLIGSELINCLLHREEFSEILALVRTPLSYSHPKLKQIIVSFDSLETYTSQISGDILFCCLGSTARKTPNLKDYRKVDYYYPLSLAEIAKTQRFDQYHLVSSLGANPDSVSSYLKMKGEVEIAIQQTGLQSVHIYRPSQLTGKRKEKRQFEKFTIGFMKILNPFLAGPLKKYRSISAAKVASAMVNQSVKKLKGIHIYNSDQIRQLA